MNNLLKVLSISLITASLFGCGSSSQPEENIKNQSQAISSTVVYNWSSSSPASFDTAFSYPQSLCVPTAFTGQTGQTYGTVGAYVYEDSTGFWELGGASTPSGFAPLSMQVLCVGSNIFYNAGFDHILIGTPQTLTNNCPIFGACNPTSLTPTSPGSTVGNIFYPVDYLGGDYSDISCHTDTMITIFGYLQFNNFIDHGPHIATSNLVQSWGFQFQDINNNPITPHTVQLFRVTSGNNISLPTSNVAFCFLYGFAGPLNSATTSGGIQYGANSAQTLYATSPGPAVNAMCIDYDLSN